MPDVPDEVDVELARDHPRGVCVTHGIQHGNLVRLRDDIHLSCEVCGARLITHGMVQS